MAVADKADHALGNDLWIIEDGSRSAAGDQRAVGVVGPVGEGLGDRPQSRIVGADKESGTGQTQDGEFGVESSDCPHHRLRLLVIANDAVVERTMGFDVGDPGAVGSGHAVESGDLVQHIGLELTGSDVHRSAAETGQIVVAHVRSDRDATFGGCRHGSAHHHGVPGVETTRDVGTGDDIEHGGVITHRPLAEAFAQIGVQIDRGGHVVHGAVPFTGFEW